MKHYVVILLLAWSMLPHSSSAQLTNGGINAFFGVDGDTRNSYVKYGPATGSIPSDDWFSFSPSGKNVIDTSNAAYYFTLLQADKNLGFSQRMSVPLYSKLNGRLWLDAVYGRDYLATNPLVDSTAFTIASKNGDNPTSWVGGITNFPDKNDLIDVFAHMRRDGISVNDSLWLFTAVATVGTSGSRYFDVELYKNSFGYSRASGVFTSAGPDAGHTQWLFDASGNIIQTGDMILAVNYSPGSAPVVDVRIWVSQSTFSSVVPAYFNFGPNFDGSTPSFGYASILSKSGATSFGSGISNYSATASQDTTYSTPWGTEQSTKNWATQYQSLQLVEIGLNLTRIGVDPALYASQGLSACQSLFSNIFFKSRSSNSFVSNMQDFVIPLDFLRTPVMDYSLQPDTLRCNHASGSIRITNNTTTGYYTWQTANGNIITANADSSLIGLNRAGTYIVSSSPAQGCPATRTDTVVIPVDTFPPVASFIVSLGGGSSYLQFLGGDESASNYPTPFGGSQGLLWSWSGPNGFSSIIQNPTNDTIWGSYRLIVTEKRNGCMDTAIRMLNSWDFIALPNMFVTLRGIYAGKSILLKWEDRNQENIATYEIEKYMNGGFSRIGTVYNILSFADNEPSANDNLYRIKAVRGNGQTSYSNIIRIRTGAAKIYLVRTSGNSASLVCNMDKDQNGTLVVYNMAGQLMYMRNLRLNRGTSAIELPVSNGMKNAGMVISLYVKDQVAFTQKLVW